MTSSCSYGITASFRNAFSGTLASAIFAATRSSSLAAATPASWSPERSGLAFASSVFRSANRYVRGPIVSV
ncbi:hypothetical protein WK29_03955 [Burkholderia vietnamiensis]|nr:hypothetical protein WK29_03955 [Burkholderia vietnamiensis]